MPHLILEASANIIEQDDEIKIFLLGCQDILVAELPTQIASCKSRFIKQSCYVVGDNNPANAFIHLTVKVLKGRSQELLQSVAIKLKQFLIEKFVVSNSNRNLKITVEIIELSDIYIN